MENCFQPMSFLLCVSNKSSYYSSCFAFFLPGDTRVFTAKTSKFSQISLLQMLYLDIVDKNGNILQYTKLSECAGILSGSITLPPGLVQYQLRGYDSGGNPFAHVVPSSSVLFKSPQLEIVLIGNAFVVVNEGRTSLVRISIRNKMKGPKSLTVSTKIITPSELQYEYVSEQVVILTPLKTIEMQIKFIASQTLLEGQMLDWMINATDTCTNKEISISFKAIVKPPITLNVTGVSKSTILLQWFPPSSPTLGNIINYTLLIDFSNGTLGAITVDNNMTNIELSGLFPYQLMYVSIIAYSDSGETAEIAPITVLTAEAGKVIAISY